MVHEPASWEPCRVTMVRSVGSAMRANGTASACGDKGTQLEALVAVIIWTEISQHCFQRHS